MKLWLSNIMSILDKLVILHNSAPWVWKESSIPTVAWKLAQESTQSIIKFPWKLIKEQQQLNKVLIQWSDLVSAQPVVIWARTWRKRCNNLGHSRNCGCVNFPRKISKKISHIHVVKKYRSAVPEKTMFKEEINIKSQKLGRRSNRQVAALASANSHVPHWFCHSEAVKLNHAWTWTNGESDKHLRIA